LGSMPQDIEIERLIPEFNHVGALAGENTHATPLVFEHNEAMTAP
jgi:hypothetical protein